MDLLKQTWKNSLTASRVESCMLSKNRILSISLDIVRLWGTTDMVYGHFVNEG